VHVVQSRNCPCPTLPEIYRNLGTDFNERVLPSIIHETLKSVVAQYNASQLITQREQVGVHRARAGSGCRVQGLGFGTQEKMLGV
jgi:regulator of protease activity HflC (stomatin/prohibitin superfamily)